jgi:peptide subunit release factor 1 (eRF1)
MGAFGLANARIGMHTLLMTSGTQTTVIFSCPKCSLFYEATQEQHPDIQVGSFKCKECNAEVHTWSGVYDFFGWKAKVMRPMRPGTGIF